MGAPAAPAAPAARSRLFPRAAVAVVSAAAVAVAVSIAAVAPRGAAAAVAREATTVRVEEILAAPGGVLKLSDGRELRARRVAVGGCASAAATTTTATTSEAKEEEATLATAKRWAVVRVDEAVSKEATASATPTPSPSSELKTSETNTSEEATPAPARESTMTEATPAPTKEAASTATPSAAQKSCLVGPSLDYRGFEGVIVEANGFKFTTSVAVHDVDAEAGAKPGAGWSETMTTVGMTDGALVAPALAAPQGSTMGVRTFVLPSASMAELGWKAPDTKVAGATANTDGLNCADGKEEAACSVVGTYASPVDTVLVLRAFTSLSQYTTSAGDPWSATLTIAAGCECAARPAAAALMVFPDPTEPGMCTRRTASRAAYFCDFLGSFWCEQVPSMRWTMADADATSGPCTAAKTVVDRPVGKYAPATEWGAVKATPSPTPSPTAAVKEEPMQAEEEAVAVKATPSPTPSPTMTPTRTETKEEAVVAESETKATPTPTPAPTKESATLEKTAEATPAPTTSTATEKA